MNNKQKLLDLKKLIKSNVQHTEYCQKIFDYDKSKIRVMWNKSTRQVSIMILNPKKKDFAQPSSETDFYIIKSIQKELIEWSESKKM